MRTDAWNDLFVRMDVSQTSPDTRHGGLASPDIIPVGTKPADPSTFATAASYGKYHHGSFYRNQPNHIFVRSKNSSPSESASGTVRLAMCDPAVVLWPGSDNWTVLKTATGSDHCDLTDVGPGAIGVTGDGGPETAPFVVTPTESGHRGLVTWLSTAKHKMPNKLPRIDTLDALVKWLIDHPNYAYHNVDSVTDATGVQTRANPFTAGNAPAKWVFALTVKMCKDYTVSFSCGRRLANGTCIQLDDKNVGSDDSFTYAIERDVEAGFVAHIHCTYNQNGLPLRDGFEFSFKASASYAPGHPLHEFGEPYHTWEPVVGLVKSPNTRIDVGSIGLVKRSVQP